VESVQRLSWPVVVVRSSREENQSTKRKQPQAEVTHLVAAMWQKKQYKRWNFC
jgi:hypothetical protein